MALLSLRCPTDMKSRSVYGIKEKDYVTIACFQKTRGAQRYVVSQNVRRIYFEAVAIWCCAFNPKFGYANLGF